MSSKYFFGFIISFIFGVGFESLAHIGYPLGILFLFVGGLLLFLKTPSSGSSSSYLVSLLVIALALGVLRVDLGKMKQEARVLDTFLNTTVTLSGNVVEEPDTRESYTNIVLNPDSVLYENQHHILKTETKILVRMPQYPVFQYGDHITLRGKLVLPKNVSHDDGTREFDYKTYLAKDNILYQMYFPQVTDVTQGDGNIVLKKLFVAKAYLLGVITRTIPEPEAALAGGILLGAKQSLGEDLLQKFRETGVAHIVVLSGYNIAIVATALALLFSFLPFTMRIVASVLGVVLFAMLVGGGATVVRATIMVLVVLLAKFLGREHDALRALMLAGGLMVLAHPAILLSDISFQLSFLATLAIVLLVPLVEKYFSFITHTTLREIFATTIATQIFVFPLILYYMGSASLVSVFANILVLPVIPFAMLASVLVALFGWVPLIGSVLAALAYGALWYVVSIVEFLAKFPFAQISEIRISLMTLIILYALLGIFLWRNYFSSSRSTSSLLR